MIRISNSKKYVVFDETLIGNMGRPMKKQCGSGSSVFLDVFWWKTRVDQLKKSEPRSCTWRTTDESVQHQNSSNLHIEINQNEISEKKTKVMDSNFSFVLPNDSADWIINDLTRDYIADHRITNQNFDVNLIESKR